MSEESESVLCANCVNPVYMTHLGSRIYRCPICQDERDLDYEQFGPPSMVIAAGEVYGCDHVWVEYEYLGYAQCRICGVVED